MSLFSNESIFVEKGISANKKNYLINCANKLNIKYKLEPAGKNWRGAQTYNIAISCNREKFNKMVKDL